MTNSMTDQELYQKAKFYGRNALMWRRKFMGLLPEVERRRLYEKKGFGSIFEFAKKLAGLSEQHVRTALNLEKRFSDKPALKTLLENGIVSVNKLVRVASIATPQNEEDLAQVVQLLPNRAVETFVRDEKQDGLFEPQKEAKNVHVHDSLKLNEEVTEKLLDLQQKGIDVNELLLGLLKQREEKIEEQKAVIIENLQTASSRYIPARIQKIVRQEHGTKCSIRTCSRPAEQLHHTQTFALSHMHNPNYLAPLCKNHHVIAHSINLKVQQKRREAIA